MLINVQTLQDAVTTSKIAEVGQATFAALEELAGAEAGRYLSSAGGHGGAFQDIDFGDAGSAMTRSASAPTMLPFDVDVDGGDDGGDGGGHKAPPKASASRLGDLPAGGEGAFFA